MRENRRYRREPGNRSVRVIAVPYVAIHTVTDPLLRVRTDGDSCMVDSRTRVRGGQPPRCPLTSDVALGHADVEGRVSVGSGRDDVALAPVWAAATLARAVTPARRQATLAPGSG